VLLGVDVMWVPVAQSESVDLFKIPFTVQITRQGDTFALAEPVSDHNDSIVVPSWHPTADVPIDSLVITGSVVTLRRSNQQCYVVARPALPSHCLSYWNIRLLTITSCIIIGVYPYDTPLE